MKQLVLAGMIAMTAATGAMAGGPHYSKSKCKDMTLGMMGSVISIIGSPAALGILPAFLVGCDHHPGYGVKNMLENSPRTGG